MQKYVSGYHKSHFIIAVIAWNLKNEWMLSYYFKHLQICIHIHDRVSIQMHPCTLNKKLHSKYAAYNTSMLENISCYKSRQTCFFSFSYLQTTYLHTLYTNFYEITILLKMFSPNFINFLNISLELRNVFIST